MIFPTHRQAPLSASAVKASAGAVEHLLLHPADDLPATLTDLRARGVRIVGADGEAPLTARQTDLRGPLALVVGSEGKGLGTAVRRRADAFMRIPMKGSVGSLNAAVAGSILLFEALAQRDAGGAAPTLEAPPEPAEPGPQVPEPGPDHGPRPEPEPTPKPKRATRRTTKAGPAPTTPEPTEADLLPADATKPKARTRRKAPTD